MGGLSNPSRGKGEKEGAGQKWEKEGATMTSAPPSGTSG